MRAPSSPAVSGLSEISSVETMASTYNTSVPTELSDEKSSDDDAKPAKLTFTFVMILATVCTANFLAGFDSGAIAGALPPIVDEFSLEPLLEGLVVSATLMGQLIGSWFSLTSFGRRIPLIVAGFFYVAGGALMFWSPDVVVLIVGRALVGYAVGVANVVVPLFLAESAAPTQRGRLMIVPYLVNVCGVFTSYVVGVAVSATSEDPSWRLMLGVAVFPSVFMAVCVFFLPDSPRVLIQKGRYADARAALVKLRGTDEVDDELSSIARDMMKVAAYAEIHSDKGVRDHEKQPLPPAINTSASTSTDLLNTPTERTGLLSPSPVDEETKASQGCLGQLRQPGVKRALMIALCVTAFQQFSGINVVVYYLPTILTDAGISELLEGLGMTELATSLLATALVYCCKIPFMIYTASIVDAFGRRRVVLSCIPIMTLSLVAIAIGFYLPEGNLAGAIVTLTAATTFGCSFSPGLGATATVMMAEIMPQSFRTTGFSLALVFSNTFNIVVAQLFPVLDKAIGPAHTFVIFASFSFAAWFFFFIFMPETTNKTLEKASQSLVQAEAH